MRRIYRSEGIKIDKWPYRFKQLRGAYFSDDAGTTVLLAPGLPEDPLVFTMAHELKHHLKDRSLAVAYCDASNQHEHIEIGAEVFAAELIFPEGEFAKRMTAMGVGLGKCSAEDLVRLKHDTRTTLSYAGLSKRAVFQGFAKQDSLPKGGWRKLEEKLYGEPIYKRILRRRTSRNS